MQRGFGYDSEPLHERKFGLSSRHLPGFYCPERWREEHMCMCHSTDLAVVWVFVKETYSSLRMELLKEVLYERCLRQIHRILGIS